MDEIRTKRLRWRLPVASDVDGYMAFVSDYEVVKWTASWPHPADRDFVVSRCVPVDRERGFAGPVFLGDVQIGGIGIMGGELGYFFAREHWGKGYATEMAAAIITRAFKNPDLGEITASVILGNGGSVAVLKKLGFQQTGMSRCPCIAQGGEYDALDYILTRERWLAQNPLLIETDRLLINAFAPGDAGAFRAIGARKEVARMMQSIPHPLSLQQAQDWIIEREYTGKIGFFAGVYLRDGTLIGAVGLGGEPVSTAYFFHPNQWGHGYATEAMDGFLTQMFAQFDLPELTAGAMVDNPASQQVLTKLGFVEIGRKMHQPSLRLEPDPLILYRLKRTEFKASR